MTLHRLRAPGDASLDEICATAMSPSSLGAALSPCYPFYLLWSGGARGGGVADLDALIERMSASCLLVTDDEGRLAGVALAPGMGRPA